MGSSKLISPTSAGLSLIHLHGADYATCMAREALKHAKAMGLHNSSAKGVLDSAHNTITATTAMHESERKKHLSAAYTTDYERNIVRGWLCTHRLESPAGVEVTEMPRKWALVDV